MEVDIIVLVHDPRAAGIHNDSQGTNLRLVPQDGVADPDVVAAKRLER
jgi:hypothetical protein